MIKKAGNKVKKVTPMIDTTGEGWVRVADHARTDTERLRHCLKVFRTMDAEEQKVFLFGLLEEQTAFEQSSMKAKTRKDDPAYAMFCMAGADETASVINRMVMRDTPEWADLKAKYARWKHESGEEDL